jgi:NAD+ synthase
MVKNFAGLKETLVKRARQLAGDCHRVLVAVSGGVDSSLVAAILCAAFGPERVVGLYRDIRSNPRHRQDVELLQKKLGFKLFCLDGNPLYDEIIRQAKEQFAALGLQWAEEGTTEAEKLGFTNAYASLKSRLTVPLAGFIAKAIDGGKGRIFGTGNGEEDGLARYFDKFGDGAVDSNILNGLTKAEVRQMARYLGVPERIIAKTPSADLESRGDAHNDEGQLTAWARQRGYSIKISYGAPDGSQEGNIAWAWKEDLCRGVITGGNARLNAEQLRDRFGYNDEEVQIVLFLRQIERETRHKVEPIPGLDRRLLVKAGLVD